MSAASEWYVAGVEGGGSHSVAYVLDSAGLTIGSSEGPGSNIYQAGMDAAAEQMIALVQQAVRAAGLPEDTQLKTLGISASGCETPETVAELRERVMTRHAALTRECAVCCDTVGAIATASETGGICLISGSGSNSLLYNPDGSSRQCGGWSYMLGEKGSAWWISYRAVKLMIQEDDNLKQPPHSTEVMRRCICEYFGVQDRFGLLEHAYRRFTKARWAGLCRRLAQAAHDGDPMCCRLFRDAGDWLGRYVVALLPSVAPQLLEPPGGLRIIADGAVFKSWSLLRDGFVARVAPQLAAFTLVQLETSLALGAAYLAAKQAQLDLPRDYSKNYSVICSWSRD